MHLSILSIWFQRTNRASWDDSDAKYASLDDSVQLSEMMRAVHTKMLMSAFPTICSKNGNVFFLIR